MNILIILRLSLNLPFLKKINTLQTQKRYVFLKILMAFVPQVLNRTCLVRVFILLVRVSLASIAEAEPTQSFPRGFQCARWHGVSNLGQGASDRGSVIVSKAFLCIGWGWGMEDRISEAKSTFKQRFSSDLDNDPLSYSRHPSRLKQLI